MFDMIRISSENSEEKMIQSINSRRVKVSRTENNKRIKKYLAADMKSNL